MFKDNLNFLKWSLLALLFAAFAFRSEARDIPLDKALFSHTTGSEPASGKCNLYFKSDDILYKYCNGGSELPVGSGAGGGLDSFLSEDYEITTVSDFSSDQNATFLTTGGTFGGALTNETGSPIAGLRSIKYTAGASSTNDWIAGPVVSLDAKQSGQWVGVSFYYKWSGSVDVEFVVKCTTGDTAEYTDSLDVISTASSPTRFTTAIFVSSSCTALKYGFHFINAPTNGDILIFDDVELSTNPFVYKNLVEMTDWTTYSLTIGATTTAPTKGTIVRDNARWRRVGDTMEIAYEFEQSAAGSAGSGTYLFPIPLGYTIDTNKLSVTGAGNNEVIVGTAWGSNLATANGDATRVGVVVPNDTSNLKLILKGTTDAVSAVDESLFGGLGGSTIVYTFYARVPITGWSVSSEHVVTPATQTVHTYYISQAGSSMTDRGGDVEFNLATATIEEVGSGGITASNDSGNTRTKFTANSAGTIIAHGAARTQNSSRTFNIWKNGSVFVGGSAVNTAGDPSVSTVSIPVAAGDYITFNASSYGGGATDGVENSSEIVYASMTFIPEKVTMLAATPVQQTCYVKNVQSSGTVGGSATAASWNDRVLNTTDGDCSFLSLSSNEITLAKGKYEIDAIAPCFGCDQNKLRFYNTTDSTVDITGQSTMTYNATPNQFSNTPLKGSVILTSSKAFKLQHYISVNGGTTQTQGLAVSDGGNEVFAIVKITKVRD